VCGLGSQSVSWMLRKKEEVFEGEEGEKALFSLLLRHQFCVEDVSQTGAKASVGEKLQSKRGWPGLARPGLEEEAKEKTPQ